MFLQKDKPLHTFKNNHYHYFSMETVHKVKASDLKTGEQVERSEHPWASRATARKIASDHLRENPSAYSHGNKHEGREVVILNQNVKVMPPRKKKPPSPPPQPSGPGWIPQNLRMWGWWNLTSQSTGTHMQNPLQTTVSREHNINSSTRIADLRCTIRMITPCRASPTSPKP